MGKSPDSAESSMSTVLIATRLRNAAPSGSPVLGLMSNFGKVAGGDIQPDAVARQEQVRGREQRNLDPDDLIGVSEGAARWVDGVAQPHDPVRRGSERSRADSRHLADERRSAWR